VNFWIREATLQIGANKYSLDSLNFSFEIPFEDSEELTTATITAMNLSENTRNNIRKGHAVIVNAGYENDIGCILVGRVAGLSHKKDSTDWTTKIIATVATNEWLDAQVYKTYKQGIRAKDMVSDLLNIFGLETGNLELSDNKEYPRGRVCRGKIKDVLLEIVVSDCKSRMLIRPTGQIVINKPGTGVNNGYLLSQETGLLKSTDEYEVIPIETNLNTQVPFDEKEEELKTRASLLNYHIGPADIIKVESPSLNGRFMVVRGRHVGSHSGDWKTEMELRPI
jgi:CYTH domain-containing protein